MPSHGGDVVARREIARLADQVGEVVEFDLVRSFLAPFSSIQKTPQLKKIARFGDSLHRSTRSFNHN